MRYSCTSLCALVLLATLPACFEPETETFANLEELNSLQKKKGYVMVEHFGEAWPATVVTERQYRDDVEIILANNEAHYFDEFEGYKLRVIKLKGKRNAELVVVYRSQEKY